MRAIIFDLDGTLIDSLPDIATAVNISLATKNLPPLPAPEIERMIGDGAKILLIKAFVARNAQMTEPDLEAFVAHYTAHATEKTAPYPGIPETLATLRQAGHKLAVCTNKPALAASKILADLHLAPFFTAIIGGDSTPHRKPDPRHLAAAIQATGGGPAVMIGNHQNDIDAASGCNIPAIFAAWGYSTAQTPHIAHHPTDLPALIQALTDPPKKPIS